MSELRCQDIFLTWNLLTAQNKSEVKKMSRLFGMYTVILSLVDETKHPFYVCNNHKTEVYDMVKLP